MRVAMPTWEGRISPVFDVAHELLVVEIGCGAELSRHRVMLTEGLASTRAARVAELGIGLLICSGVSRPLADAMRARGITVLSQRAGLVDQVVGILLRGGVPSPSALLRPERQSPA